MHRKPITSSRKKLQADSLSRQKCYAAYLRSLLTEKNASTVTTNTTTTRGAK